MAQKSDEVRKSIITMCFRLLLDSNNCKTLLQNATTNGGVASRGGGGGGREESAFTKLCLELLIVFFFPDARRVAPISSSVLCLRFMVAFCACALC